jgi:hypothetical protein
MQARILRPMPSQRLPRISVKPSSAGSGVWCDEPVAAGRIVLEFDGAVRPVPARFSVQVGAHEHIHPDDDAVLAQDLTRFRWRFLNHSCAPTCRVEGRRLVALRDLAAGEELTFDYNATEWSMAEPFACACGACGGSVVRGFAHLDAVARAQRSGWIAEHLVERMAHADA